MHAKFVKVVVKSPEEIYPACLERGGMGKFSIPPTSKKVGWEKLLSHLPRWDRILAEAATGTETVARSSTARGYCMARALRMRPPTELPCAARPRVLGP